MKPNKSIKEWQKHAVLAEYAQRFRPKVFIETGTFRGDTIKAMLGRFERLYTIDTNEIYAGRAQQRFAAHPVKCLCMDSAVALPEILRVEVHEPCLFWLDAHHVGTKHHGYVVSAPIREELACILEHECARDHVILIDDAWFFRTEEFRPGIPAVEEIEAIVKAKFPDWVFEVELDIIRCHRSQ